MPVAVKLTLRRYPFAQRTTLVAVYSFFLSMMIWRSRASEEIAATPLDLAGVVRVAFLGVAFACALMAISATGRWPRRTIPGAVRLYGAYAMFVPLGALAATSPFFVLFRFGELVVMLTIVFAIWVAFERDPTVPIRHLILALQMLMLSVCAGVIVAPDRALTSVPGPIPWRIGGVFPTVPANDVGVIAVIIALWAMSRRRPVWLGLALGVLLLSQYRTGYVGLVAGVLALFAARRLAGKVMAAGILLIALGVYRTDFGQELWNRDTPEAALRTLNGRQLWWNAALEVHEKHPWFGAGLGSVSRFDVFPALGLEQGSNLHSTWVEALAGTGYFGVMILTAFIVVGAFTVYRHAVQTGESFGFPFVVLLLVRSITGNAFEVAHWWTLLLLLVIMAAYSRPSLGSPSSPRTQNGSRGDEEGRNAGIGFNGARRYQPGSRPC